MELRVSIKCIYDVLCKRIYVVNDRCIMCSAGGTVTLRETTTPLCWNRNLIAMVTLIILVTLVTLVTLITLKRSW